MAHEIRLAGPWEFQVDESGDWQRCILPFDFAAQAQEDHSLIRIRRRFHRPSGLTPASAVFIVFDTSTVPQQITVNDHEVHVQPSDFAAASEAAADLTCVAEVTNVLEGFNTVCFFVSAESIGQLSNVRLRIIESS